MMRIFLAGFLTESNSFSLIPTTLEDFQHCCFTTTLPDREHASYWETPLCEFSERAAQCGWHCFNSLCATAMASGLVTQEAYNAILSKILDDLDHCLPIDAVFLHLHGGMIADHLYDCEGDILKNIRQHVGNQAIIAALLDPHTHLTTAMKDYADLLLAMQEYPHTDIVERTEQLFQLTKQTLEKKIQPVMNSYDCRTINIFPTKTSPMREFVTKIKMIEETDPEILSISPIHGFPWGDTPDTSTKLLVITNGYSSHGEAMTRQLGNEFKQLANTLSLPTITLDEAITRLETVAPAGPIILADYADNPGGGAPGDSTFILEALIAHQVQHFVFSSLYDPASVSVAMKVGKNSRITLTLGGKLSHYSGVPLALTLDILDCIPDMKIRFANTFMNFGNTVAGYLTALDAIIIFHDKRCQTYSTDCFTKFGIDLTKQRAIIVKSSEHFRDSFSSVSKNIAVVETPGVLNPNIKTIPYKNNHLFKERCHEQ